jgi:RNase P/RNase MRP subunit p29
MTPQKALANAAPVAAPLAFDSWIGLPVILHTSVGELCVPLRGTVVRETHSLLRFRIGEGWDVDIFKSMVLGIEQDSWNGTT